MATLCLINFPEFSESKEFLKIGQSEVCVLGRGGDKGRTNKLSLSVYVYMRLSTEMTAPLNGRINVLWHFFSKAFIFKSCVCVF